MMQDEDIIQEDFGRFLYFNHSHLINPTSDEDKRVKVILLDGFRAGVEYCLTRVESMIDSKSKKINEVQT